MAAEAAQRGDWDTPGDSTVIDCDRCTMRGIGCGDCVVTVLLGAPPVRRPGSCRISNCRTPCRNR